MELLPSLTQAVVIATQAIVAAIIEERFVLTADENGFRNRAGNFVSRRHAYLRAIFGVGAIAVSVLLIPYVASTFFVNQLIQTAGLALVAGVALIHQIVNRWNLDVEDYVILFVGTVLLLTPYGLVGGITAAILLVLGAVVEHYGIRERFSVEDAKKGVDAVQQEPSEVVRIVIVVVLREESPYEAIDAVKSPQSKDRRAEEAEE